MLGIYCIVLNRDLFKIIIGFILMEYSVFLLFILFGYGSSGVSHTSQVIVISLITAGLGSMFTLIAISIRIYERFGTIDTKETRSLKG